MSSALGAVASRKISLITTDVKTRKLIGVSRKTLEEALRSLNIATNVLAKWNKSMWFILLASEEAAKLAWSVLAKKATHRLYGNPQNQDDASRGDHGCLREPLQSSARRSLPLKNLTLIVTRRNFVDIPDTLISRRRNIVEELVSLR